MANAIEGSFRRDVRFDDVTAELRSLILDSN